MSEGNSSSSAMKVGQTLWFVPGVRWRGPHAVTVTKIGRRWATLDNDNRIDRDTLIVEGKDGYTSTASCWKSEEEYVDTVLIAEAWGVFKRDIPYRAPKGMTLTRIAELRVELVDAK